VVEKTSDQTSRCHLGRDAAEKHADDSRTATTAIAQSLLTGPLVTLSKTHLTPQEVAKWKIEAGTFDSRTLTTTISERSWAMIELKIDSSRTLHKAPRKDWQEEWDMNTSFKALEEVYALDSRVAFWMHHPFGVPSRTTCVKLHMWIPVTLTSYQSRTWLSSWNRAFTESYVAFIRDVKQRIRWNRQPLERHEHKCDVSPRVRE